MAGQGVPAEALPLVLFSGGPAQAAMAAELRAGLYAEAPARLLDLAGLTGLPGAGIEDLLPAAFPADPLDRLERRPETRLGDVVVEDHPFGPQVEAWARAQGIALPADWRLAVTRRARALATGPEGFAADRLELWARLFDRPTADDAPAAA